MSGVKVGFVIPGFNGEKSVCDVLKKVAEEEAKKDNNN